MRCPSSLLLAGLLLAGLAAMVAGPRLTRAQSDAAPQWAGGDDSGPGCDGGDCGRNSGEDSNDDGAPGPGTIRNPIGAMVPGRQDFRRQADENAVRLHQKIEDRTRQASERREELLRQAGQGAQEEEQGAPAGAYRMPTVQGLAPGINPGQTNIAPSQDDDGDEPQ